MTIHASKYVTDAADRARILDLRDHQRQRLAHWERLEDLANEHRNEPVAAYAAKWKERYRLALWGMGFEAFSAETADREARATEDYHTKPWKPS